MQTNQDERKNMKYETKKRNSGAEKRAKSQEFDLPQTISLQRLPKTKTARLRPKSYH